MINLFLICPNNSGSTLLKKYLIKCKKVVNFPEEVEAQHTVMGKYMPADTLVSKPWTEHTYTYTNVKNYDWPKIREIWNKYWKDCAKSKNISIEKSVAIAKSPPDILRTDMLRNQFPYAKYIVLVRNPYAMSEGYNRRHGISLERCGRHFISCLRKQMYFVLDNPYNVYFDDFKVFDGSIDPITQTNSISLKYEQLTEEAGIAEKFIKWFLPELSDLKLDQKVTCHTLYDRKDNRGLENLNWEQTKRLSHRQIKLLTNIFKDNYETMKFWGYESYLS